MKLFLLIMITLLLVGCQCSKRQGIHEEGGLLIFKNNERASCNRIEDQYDSATGSIMSYRCYQVDGYMDFKRYDIGTIKYFTKEVK